MNNPIVRHIKLENFGKAQTNTTVDQELEVEIARIKDELGPQYFLLSIAPAGTAFVSGAYITVWDYDDSNDDVKSNDEGYPEESIAEDDCAVSPLSGIMDEVFGPRPTRQFIGDDEVHDVKFGEIICINGVNFKLTHFGQDYEEAMATLTPLKEVEGDSYEPPARTYGAPDSRADGIYTRYGQSFEVSNGIRRRTPLRGYYGYGGQRG